MIISKLLTEFLETSTIHGFNHDEATQTPVDLRSYQSYQFSNVTVCPPKNTLTNINPDLSISKNLTLDDRTRSEVEINLS